MTGCRRDCLKLLLKLRDSLTDIDQKISHLIEQSREDREAFFRDYGRDKDD